MLSRILSLTLLSRLVLSSHSVLEHFNDVSVKWPKENSNIPLVVDSALDTMILENKDNSEAVEYCANMCLEYSYFCHTFMLVEIHMEYSSWRKCRVLTTLSTIHPSQALSGCYSVVPLVVYERKTMPTPQDLIQRFSLENPSGVSEKYGVIHPYSEISDAVLSHINRAFIGTLPALVDTKRWFEGTSLSKCKISPSREFKRQIIKGLQSWKSQPVSKEALAEFSDIIVLTYLEIFFKSLDQDVITVFDPVAKILVVEGPKTHMLIRSFGPGHYVVLNADNSEVKGVLKDVNWQTTESARSNLDENTFQVFRKAMSRFGHRVSDGNILSEENIHATFEDFIDPNELELGVSIIVSAVGLVLFSKPMLSGLVTLNIFQRDIVTAVIAKALENSHVLHATLHQTLQRINAESMLDVDIITQGK